MFQNLTLALYKKNYFNRLWSSYNFYRNDNVPLKFIKEHMDEIIGISVNNVMPVNNMWSLDLLEKYMHRIEDISLWNNPNLTIEFIEKHIDIVDWHTLEHSKYLTLDFVNKYMHKFLSDSGIIFNKVITPDILEKNLDKINECDLSIHPALTLEFIEKHIEKFNTAFLSTNPCLTPEFIEKYAEKLNWNLLSFNPNLKMETIEKFADRICFGSLFANLSLNLDFIKKYFDKLGLGIWSHPALTIEFIEENIENVSWYYVAQNPNLTIEFIEKYKNKLDADLLARNELNYHPVVFNRNKKKYAEKLKVDLEQYFRRKNQIQYDVQMDILRLRIRDIRSKPKRYMI